MPRTAGKASGASRGPRGRAPAVAGYGLLHVLTGDGRGKTTSALGLALRAYGRGARVAVIQFVKRASGTGEELAARKLGPRFIVKPMGAGFVRRTATRRDVEAARSALAEAELLARPRAGRPAVDMLVLDEVIVALRLGLVTPEELEKLVRLCAGRVELVLTGRGAPGWLKRLADYCTDMREVKHPFSRGLISRRGVEL